MKKSIFLLLSLCLSMQLSAQNWDINTVKTINKWDVHGLSRGLSASGVILPVGVPAAMGIYALIKKDQPLLKDAIYIGTSVIEAVGITYAAKHIIGRDRPFVKYPDKIHVYGAPDADSPSFPSGHTAAAFSLATSLSITYPKWYVIAPSAVWACGVGFARINQGVHYPSDVVAGAAIGVGCAFANIYINRWLNKILFKKK
ncbi:MULTISPECIES: phosphatase PAP2 family protein [Phocaeicola]|jgi:membrane-associated phospholipid phosphatase|nr:MULTISPECIES: phosphatase PAP2 family protein [Phocaeicola]MBS1343562.1 phosphatase PAP2 family protein [Bacteroides sp.]RGE99238.1 phosphatase PAP2 family protein [Bacteroides sp. AM22-3LB]RGF14311.1 phosphatase PAP2 family protein [Bacteroides sp. AM16-15]RGI04970.1 phosphatase PAP2 family protein [Bacteroides sp. AM25-34]MBS4839111.1 phosphatase PAP2 family protein [Phocaeicola massiliensis]